MAGVKLLLRLEMKNKKLWWPLVSQSDRNLTYGKWEMWGWVQGVGLMGQVNARPLLWGQNVDNNKTCTKSVQNLVISQKHQVCILLMGSQNKRGRALT